MTKWFTILLLTLIPTLLPAKDLTQGKFGLGLYLGGPTLGLYGDIPTGPKNNVNVMMTFTGHYFYMHGDYLWNWPVSEEVESFKLYAGPGMELASINEGQLYWGKDEAFASFQFGLRGVVGIRISLPKIPLGFNLQFSPVFMLSPKIMLVPSGGAGLRYYF